MVRWTPALAVGHDAIDAQHEELFGRLGKLLDAMLSGDRAEIGRLFEFLGSYVAEHFAEEERLMTAARYPDLAMHRAAHQRFVREYAELRHAFEASGATASVTIGVKTWLVEWLKSHVSVTDRALARHLATDRCA